MVSLHRHKEQVKLLYSLFQPCTTQPVKNKSLLLGNHMYFVLEDSPIEGHIVYVQRTSPMGHYSVHIATCIYVQCSHVSWPHELFNG